MTYFYVFSFYWWEQFFYLRMYVFVQTGAQQERIKRSLQIHYILESTFARILLFLELPFLQGVSIYRENLFPLTSAYKRPK